MNPGNTAYSRLRRLETGLAWFSLGVLLIYIPVETPLERSGLASPGFLVDAFAMALLLASGVHSLRSRPRIAIAPLCGAWGWCACLAWRSYFTRVISRHRGLGIYPPEAEWEEKVLVWVLVIALIVFAFSFVLAWQSAAFTRLPQEAEA